MSLGRDLCTEADAANVALIERLRARRAELRLRECEEVLQEVAGLPSPAAVPKQLHDRISSLLAERRPR